MKLATKGRSTVYGHLRVQCLRAWARGTEPGRPGRKEGTTRTGLGCHLIQNLVADAMVDNTDIHVRDQLQGQDLR